MLLKGDRWRIDVKLDMQSDKIGKSEMTIPESYRNKTTTPKLLLITAGTMNSIDGGTVLFQTLLRNIPTDRLCWAVAGGWSRETPAWMQDRSRCVCESALLFHPRLAALARRTLLRHFWWWYTYRWYPARAARRIAEFARQEQAEKIWVSARGTSIPVTVRLRKMLNLPIHVTVHDDIEAHITTREAEWLRDDFEELLHTATTCSVVSDSMRDYYQERYGVCGNAPVIWAGEGASSLPASITLKRRFRRIGYAGNIWCPETMEILLKALNVINAQRSDTERITLEVHSVSLPPHFQSVYSDLAYGGLLPAEDVVTALQECDLLYVPMSFLPGSEVISRTSIPAKMLVYMQAQIPFLAHGPEYASNVRFTQLHNVGMVSTCTDPLVVAADILRYEQDFEARVNASQRCRELWESDFSPERVWARFQDILYAVNGN